ncbi:MAG: hypothetical protein WCK15_18310 [Pirellula sp.]
MNATEWIESFTGLKVADGEMTGGKDLLSESNAFEDEARIKQTLLIDVRRKLGVVKKNFQDAMQADVKVKDKFFKQKLLNIDGTQLDEADFTEIDWEKIEFEPATQLALHKGTVVISEESTRLKQATVEREGQKVPLFTVKEIEDEFWTPLVRERIMPETFVADMHSNTRRMIEETNKLYEQAIAVKKEKGELTADYDLGRDVFDTTGQLLAIGASLTKEFGDSDNGKRAAQILLYLSEANSASGKIYDNIQEKEFADASSFALDNISLLTTMILQNDGASEETIAATKSGFSSGVAAIKAGKAFAPGGAGVDEGLDALGDALKGFLDSAAAATRDPVQKKRLQLAAASAPKTLKGAALTLGLKNQVEEGNAEGCIQCLTKASLEILATVQEVRKIEAQDGLSDEQAEELGKKSDDETQDIAQIINLAGFGAAMAGKAAITLHRGEYEKSFDGVIDDIGKGLEKVLIKSGVDEKAASMIANSYKAASSAPKILQKLCFGDNPPDISGALDALGEGVETAFQAAAPENTAMLQAGTGIRQGLQGINAAKKIRKHYKEEEYEEGVAAFTAELSKQIDGIFKIKEMKTPDEIEKEEAAKEKEEAETSGEDGVNFTNKDGLSSLEAGASDVAKKDKEAQKKENEDTYGGLNQPDEDEDEDEDEDGEPKPLFDVLLTSLGETAKEVSDKIEENLKKAEEEKQKALDELEVAEILAEANADVAEMSEAQKAGAEASSIDRLIAKMEKDRFIMQAAVSIIEGGTAFLAKFVPALGAASAGVKMAANMVAAGQRAQQLYAWVESKRDFEAAQNELTSSAQNFVKNQRDQFAHYSIQCAFKAAELIGGILNLGGISAAAGTGVTAVASAGASLENIIYEHFKKRALEVAWSKTVASFKNPGNRKLGLEVRSQNPTLAKYSIAWGAVVKGDPLARNALRACELNEATLRDEKTNVNKVVDYLEKFYQDDDKLYREIETQAKWVPQEITLTLRSWSKIKRLAVINVNLDNPDTGKLDGLIAGASLDISKIDDQESVAARIELLSEIDKALHGYEPKTSTPEGKETMLKIVEILRKQVTYGEKKAEERLAKLIEEAREKTEEEVREQEKLAAKRLTLLKTEEGAKEELDVQIAKVGSCEPTDELGNLTETYEEAVKLIAELKLLTELENSRDVSSKLRQLADEIILLEGMIP